VSALEQVLALVQRRLRRERWAVQARRAAWGSAVVALLAVVLHLWVRPVSTGGMLAVIALPWLLAALQSLAIRPDRAQCAQWADLHLGGQSGFVTLHELTDPQTTAPATAITHLEAWLDDVSRSALPRLQGMPIATNLARPLATAIVCALLAAALLQLPAQRLAAPHAVSAAESVAAADRSASAARPDPLSPDGTSVPRAPDEDALRLDTGSESSSGTSTATRPSQQQADSHDDSTKQVREPPSGTHAAAQASATGREAGDSADAGGDAALVAPWQESLVSQLREITAAQPPPAGRAEATEFAEYAATAGIPNMPPGVIPPEAAAADPPPATTTLKLGPAELGYVRAYWADTGATP